MDIASLVPSTRLYHYTSASALYGIISDRSLWATNILYLNDTTELSYSQRMALKVIEAFLKTANAHELRFLDELHWQVAGALEQNKRSIYVCCFSEQRDDLSQWRGYCPDGIGFCIGFDASNLEPARCKYQFRWVKCIYREEEQAQQLQGLIKRCISEYHRATSELFAPDNIAIHSLADDFMVCFLHIAPTFKHPAFSNENE